MTNSDQDSSTAAVPSGAKVLITGGSRGIGRAIVSMFVSAGAQVVFSHYRDQAIAAEVVDRARGLGTSPLAIDSDVSDEGEVDELVDRAVSHLGEIDALVNNAGVLQRTPLLDTGVEVFDRVLAINLRGPFLMARRVARVMATQAGIGSIVNMASDYAHLGAADFGAYAASKGGVISMTRSWARELAPKILVNAIAPGPIETDMLGPDFYTGETLASELNSIPLKRAGRPEEVAAMVLFLCSPSARFITGQCIGVNGGSAMA